MPTTAPPVLLTDPGYLFWAPLLSTEPTNTVVASKFTDAWPVAWVSLGATEAGSTFTYTTSVEAITVAEFLDPVKQITTERSGNMAFNLASWTLANIKRAFNGGALSVVSGTGATTLSKFEAPVPGAEVRAMIGWESLDSTVRLVCRQTLNAGEISSAFAKGTSNALIPCQFNFEVPAAGTPPFTIWSAGDVRAGA